MGLQSFCGKALSFFLFVFAVSFCYADDKTIQVVGIVECADCNENNIKTTHAFSGLRVTVDCKAENGKIKTRGEGGLDKDGKFKVSLPKDIVKDGKLKEDCYAQLHSASAVPCPAHNGIEASKIVFTKSENSDQIQTLKPAGNLKFSSALCTSKFFWHHFKHLFPFPPIFKKPLPPPIPIYKPKPKPPVPIPPIYKPKPKPKPPVLIPPSIPIYKPKPKPLVPPIPIYKPIPPLFKKPWPPLFPKVPIMHPKIPPNYFDHPLFPPLHP